MKWLKARSALLEKAVMRLGHYSTLLLLGVVAVSVANDAAARSNGALKWTASTLWVAWIIALVADIGRHQERLCERCIAASPLDPQAAVTRWRKVLWLHHARRVQMSVLGAVIAWSFISAPVFSHRAAPAWARAVDALLITALGAIYAVTWQHRRLYPWCPFCYWGGGGAHEVPPDVPAPAQSR